MRQWDWDEYGINEAYLAARKSKDNSTQVGACLLGPAHEVRMKGYNGPVRGDDDDDPRLQLPPLKAQRFEHAERNVLYGCARCGIAAAGCCLYVTWPPCIDCARGIIQSGIVELVYHYEAPIAPKWRTSCAAGLRLLRRTGVRVRWWSGVPCVQGVLFAGQPFDFGV